MDRQLTIQLLWAGLLLPATLLLIGIVLTRIQQMPERTAITLPVNPESPSYLERVADFQQEWNKANDIVNDQMLGLYEWDELLHQTEEVQKAWAAVLAEEPTEAILPPDSFTRRRFAERREAVTLALNHFSRMLGKADREAAATATDLVNQEVERFVALFADKVKLADKRA